MATSKRRPVVDVIAQRRLSKEVRNFYARQEAFAKQLAEKKRAELRVNGITGFVSPKRRNAIVSFKKHT